MKLLILVLALIIPSSPPPASMVYGSNGRLHEVALTFDAGADRGFAARILTTLERMHVRATFGMTGRWAQANPDLVRRMARDRDPLMNHTYDHRSFTGLSQHTGPLSPTQRTWEIDRTESIARSLTGHSTKPFFRPPFGDFDTAGLSQVRRLGYRFVVMWSVDSLGWQRLPAPAILQRCLALIKPGGIILMHVGIQSQDAFALPALIAALRGRGFHLVTIPQMFRH